MCNINITSRALFLALAVFLLNGITAIATADDTTGKGSVESQQHRFTRKAQIHVSHPDGLKTVTWYEADTSKKEDSKTFKNCPNTETINISKTNGDSHNNHDHYVVIEPCKGDTETWKVTAFFPGVWTAGSFEGTGNTVETDNSAMVMEVTDINLDGLPDIVVVDKSSTGNINITIKLGYGDGTFEDIGDNVDTLEPLPLK